MVAPPPFTLKGVKILMVASEAVPFVKTGGLADVLGALPIALKEQGDEVAIVIPRYQSVSLEGAKRVFEGLAVGFRDRQFRADIWRTEYRHLTYYFVDCPSLYHRNGIYGDNGGDFADNPLRYAVLSQAAIGIARHLFRPDIFHCHDWQTGLVPLYLKFMHAHDPAFQGSRSVFTIHNVGYQGNFPQDQLWHLGLDNSFWNPGGIEFYGRGSLLKAGIVWSDFLTTVSPTHAKEIQTPEYGFGMDGLLRSRADRLLGILNGCDYHEWNPETDRDIAAHYSSFDLEGKWACKRDLLHSFQLPSDDLHMRRPLVGIVSRFAYQKGLDLVGSSIAELVNEDITLVALGSGERQYEDMFNYFHAQRPDKVRVWIGHNNPLAHKMDAGADMFLMPSRYEPCGLNQMYSQRYGTLPIVRATGGLDDTVDGHTGFKFWGLNGGELTGAVRYAVGNYWNRGRWLPMMREAMNRDYSWERSAAEYRDVYQRLMYEAGRA
jgi:starch synthase